jgi:hypothetical protein
MSYRLPLVLSFSLVLGACGDDTPPSTPDVTNDVADTGADATGDTPTGTEICFNARDDDGDGDVDCDDTDCDDDSACRAEEICDNGVDDNGDGLADCDDPGCAGEISCSCPESSIEGLGYVEGETVEGSSNLSGSCGGDAAPEATFSWTAPEAGTYTIDTVDSRFDTLIYVFDGTCGGEEIACNDDLYAAEACSVEGDEDGNGLADCDDPHCATSHLCIEDAPEDCGNEEDDDADGDIDCDDADCGFDPGCIWSTSVYQSLVTVDLEAGQEIVIVVDGFDADEVGEFFVNIANDRNESEAECDDDLDDDIDGLYDCADPDCNTADGCTADCDLEDLGSALGEVATGDTTEARRNFVGTCSGVGDPHMSGGRNARDEAYLWTAPGTGDYVFHTEDSDRFGEEMIDSVLYIREGDCDGRELACNDDVDTEAENYLSEVTLTMTAGDEVVIIVDGWRYSEGQFALTIEGPEGEPEPVEEICDNGLDDDEDEAIDCADDDCAEFEGCLD